MAVKVGEKAPDFVLKDTNRNDRALKDFLGKKTVLAFFPGAFTGVCTKELCAFRDSLANLNRLNAQVVAISVDSPFSNKAFADVNNLSFPVLSDYSRETLRKYGIAHTDFAGMKGYTAAYRSIFVLDGNGIIRYAWVSQDPSVEPFYEEITDSLSSIK